ncbi:MAG: hypothetical protein AABO57_08070 [Acidobacteriota bacterium]
MFRVFFLFAIILLSAPGATAQTRPAVKPPEGKILDKFPTDADQEGGLPSDMRIKMAIARAEGEHKKVLEDVEKLSNLSGEIARGYGERKQLSADDLRKLGTIEKLAKRVLTNAGGEEVDRKSDTDERMPLADAIDKLSATAANIRKEMTAETRFVVSATVIANSNEVISLARFIRRQKAD